jgi:hypothetical protein
LKVEEEEKRRRGGYRSLMLDAKTLKKGGSTSFHDPPLNAHYVELRDESSTITEARQAKEGQWSQGTRECRPASLKLGELKLVNSVHEKGSREDQNKHLRNAKNKVIPTRLWQELLVSLR